MEKIQQRTGGKVWEYILKTYWRKSCREDVTDDSSHILAIFPERFKYNSLDLNNSFYEIDTITIIPILWRGKVRHREINWFISGHQEVSEGSKIWTQEVWPEFMLPTTLLCYLPIRLNAADLVRRWLRIGLITVELINDLDIRSWGEFLIAMSVGANGRRGIECG